MSLRTLASKVLPYTYGDRASASGYMTNPATGTRFTPQEFKEQIKYVSQNWQVANPYLADEQHAYDRQG